MHQDSFGKSPEIGSFCSQSLVLSFSSQTQCRMQTNTDNYYIVIQSIANPKRVRIGEPTFYLKLEIVERASQFAQIKFTIRERPLSRTTGIF